MSFTGNTEGGGILETTQNKTKTQSTIILDQYRVMGFYAR
jgi:hypothetical protein